MLFNEVVTGKTIDDVWKEWLSKITNIAENSPAFESRDGAVVGEVINAITVIEDPTRCIMLNKIRKMPIRYAIGEMLWYASGSTKLSEIGKYTSAWERMSDDGRNVNSNYGYCIKHKFGFDQYENVKMQLSSHPETRQAVIHIKEARDLVKNPSKDVNCTVCLQFFVRDGKLYMTTYMRSNDMWMGFPYDVFQFTAIQVLLSMELGLELGTYTHIAGSLHLYKRDYNVALKNKKDLEEENNIYLEYKKNKR